MEQVKRVRHTSERDHDAGRQSHPPDSGGQKDDTDRSKADRGDYLSVESSSGIHPETFELVDRLEYRGAGGEDEHPVEPCVAATSINP